MLTRIWNKQNTPPLLGGVQTCTVTMDITMPVLDGLGALEKIMELNSEANIIMVTAAGQKEKMVEAIKHGAIEFIQKPFNPDQITTAIEHLMP